MWVQRRAHAWHFAYRTERGSEAYEFDPSCAADMWAETEAEHRYVTREAGNSVVLEPRVPDRPLVWRPARPLTIAAGEEAVLFIRTPLWLALRLEGCDFFLWDAPLRPLSDTWIGAPTEFGGYAYSAEPDVFLSSDQVPEDMAHATMPIVIRNSAKALLHLERLNLPVPFLSLFAGAGGHLWTQEVKLERQQEDHELSVVHISKGAPSQAPGAKLVAGPRTDAEKNVVFQAFKRFFL